MLNHKGNKKTRKGFRYIWKDLRRSIEDINKTRNFRKDLRRSIKDINKIKKGLNISGKIYVEA